jgi:hypothetical protein
VIVHDLLPVGGEAGEVVGRVETGLQQPPVPVALRGGGEQEVVDLLIDAQGRLFEDLRGAVKRALR